MPCFASSLTDYTSLLAEWAVLSRIYPGWTLTEIQNLTKRERNNWLEMANVMSGRK